MNRLEEINSKHDRLRDLLQARQADALWLRATRNIAWFTAGADASIAIDGDNGAYSVLVTADRRIVYTNNIELTRLRAEEDFESLGFVYEESPWHAARQPDTPHMLVESDVEADLLRLRLVLLAGEAERLRALGRDTAAAVAEAASAARPGDTEYQIAARLAAAARARGGIAVVNLIATDERISQFRHPLPTSKVMDKYVMVVVCMRRHGLVVSATRLAYAGAVPAEIAEKNRRVAAVDAAAIAATRPGRTLGAVFADIQAAYAAQGEAGQWQHHHQGGPAGYNARERIAAPGDPWAVQADTVYAWNPSIVGSKSEDTIFVREAGFEIVSAGPDAWPMVEVSVNGQTIKRPAVLAL
ncbi:MAG: peptidase M24 [Chloroflexota bacterium]|nr:MAG: peptidase M24 [Chloroflexota bacterium]